MKARTPWLFALAAAALVAVASQLDGPDDIQAEKDVEAYNEALAFCHKFGRQAVWTHAGDLVCRGTDPVIAKRSDK